MDHASFFDEENTNTLETFMLWKKISSSNRNHHKVADVIYQGTLFKSDSVTSTLKEAFFVLTEDKLYYKKKSTDQHFRGYMNLGFTRLEVSQDSAFSSAADKHRIRFIENLKFSDLFAGSEAEFSAWITALTPRTIRTDFHERFKLLTELGRGTYGKTFQVQDTSGNQLAAKAISKELISRNSFSRASLKNEVMILRSLNHPSIMQLLEVHETKSSLYLVCEYIEGKTLFEYLQVQTDFLSDQEIISLVYGILKAVCAMSSKGIVHRDIRLENIMLINNSNLLSATPIKIVHFGLATGSQLEYIHPRCGTPGYVAPEIISGEDQSRFFKISSKVDVFATGVIMYSLLTGENPFIGGDIKTTLRKTFEGNVNFQHDRLKNKGLHLLNLLKGMLKVDPNIRLSAAEALTSEVFAYIATSQTVENGRHCLKLTLTDKGTTHFSHVIQDIEVCHGLSKNPGKSINNTTKYDDQATKTPCSLRTSDETVKGPQLCLSIPCRKSKFAFNKAADEGTPMDNQGEQIRREGHSSFSQLLEKDECSDSL